MRLLPFITSTLITGALVFGLHHKWKGIPSLGPFLSPQQGFWQNADPADKDYNQDLKLPGLKGKTTVYLDGRLVPHVFAEQEADAYYAQGYLHAKFRLWQLEFQVMFGAGRLSEIVGNDDPRILKIDRAQRRLGMVYAAEQSLKTMEADPVGKSYFDAYTAGINAYINDLSASELPIEYKMLGYRPEPWSNLKTALFIKVMSKDLAGYERDLEFTNEKSVFSVEQMKLLFNDLSDSSLPIVPKGTVFEAPGIVPQKPATADSLYFGKDTTLHVEDPAKPRRENGSNNWVVAGTRTASGAPILCNDPHLTLTLPSIWFEMQLHTPTMNAYGATFPGAPGVIIGFNDNIAFGFTNAMRDVRDYFTIRFKDASKKEYWFNNQWTPTTLRIEEIKVAGSATVYDTVAYTHFGPVMYDESFTNEVTGNKALAVKWAAHEGSNEAAVFFKLDRAHNYDEYLDAIKGLHTPGQNMIFASKTGDIALWAQGKFPARWEGQGLYVMPGEDTSYDWQGYIPQAENPHIVNPPEGFIQSANQRPVDSSYPYFIPGNYIVPRGRTIFRALEQMQQATPQKMMALQTSYYNSLAHDAVPLILRNIIIERIDDRERRYLEYLQQYDFQAGMLSPGTTVFETVMDSLQSVLLGDELSRVPAPKKWPDDQTLVEILLRDSAAFFVDDIRTVEKETLPEQVTAAFKKAAAALQAGGDAGLSWQSHNNPMIYHLLRIKVDPLGHGKLNVGGTGNTPNAVYGNHGPSWRMVVQLTETTEAYGIYPGGQSGNPGSRFYDNFTNDWSEGKYYTLWMMQASEARDPRVKWIMTFNPS
jgi:penicillin amidase